MSFAEQLDEVLKNISEATSRAGRKASDITLIAVSKTHPVSEMQSFESLVGARGIRAIFGENYVQELRKKRPQLASSSEIHLLGAIQSNKVRDAVTLCDVIQSVHSMKVLLLVSKEASRISKRQRVYLQVNISSDPRKSGFNEEELSDAVRLAAENEGSIELEGLMAITALYDCAEDARPDFRRMAELRRRLTEAGLHESFRGSRILLSMGMSADYVVAIEEGADLVRVGTALFGERA